MQLLSIDALSTCDCGLEWIPHVAITHVGSTAELQALPDMTGKVWALYSDDGALLQRHCPMRVLSGFERLV